MFFKTDDFMTPGVNQYSTLEARMKQIKRSPNAIISQSPRFKPDKLNSYRSNIPAQYTTNPNHLLPNQVKMCTIGKQKRWVSQVADPTPGVGQYDLTRFKNY